jgi:ABC-type glycerol-3-phosphate transport system substrate-binding protein
VSKRWRLVPIGIALAVLAPLALWITGCGEEEPEDDIIFWHSMAGDLKSVLETLVDRFNQGRTKHRIVLRYQGEYGNLKNKITTALQADSPPDLAQMYEAWTSFYNSEKGHEALRPLNDLIERDKKELHLEDVYPVMLADNTWDGKVYSFPFNKSFQCLFYNKELFKRADLKGVPETWEQFRDFGQKLCLDTNNDGKQDTWGWAFNVDPTLFLDVVIQNNGVLAEGDANIRPLNSPEMARAIGYFQEAIEGPHPWAYRTNGREFQNDFISQRVAMIVTTCVSKSFMIDQLGFEWGMAPLPQGPKKAAMMAGTNIGIFAHSPKEKQEAAWEFIKFFTSTESQAFWAMRTAYVPVRRSSVDSAEFQKFLKTDPTPMAAIQQMDYATFEPRAQVWADMRDKLGQTIQKILLKNGSSEENLRALQAQLEHATRK